MKLAEEAMEKYHLTHADIEAEQQEAGTPKQTTEYQQTDSVGRWSGLAGWEGTLSQAIVKLVGTVGVYKTTKYQKTGTFGKPGRKGILTWYGSVEDTTLAAELFDEWAHVIATIGTARYGGCFRGDGASYCIGFARALHEKASAEARQRWTPPQVTTSAIVKLGHSSMGAMLAAKKNESKNWLASQGVRLGSGSGGSGRIRNHDAYSDGQSDGRRAAFTTNRSAKLTA
jgi:hypothetical protein